MAQDRAPSERELDLLKVMWELGEAKVRDIPHIPELEGDAPWPWTFTKFDYDSRRTGFSLSTGKTWRDPGREIDDVYRANLYFRLENVRIDDLSSEAPPNAYILEGLNREHRLGLGLRWSHVDIPAAPGRANRGAIALRPPGIRWLDAAAAARDADGVPSEVPPHAEPPADRRVGRARARPLRSSDPDS